MGLRHGRQGVEPPRPGARRAVPFAPRPARGRVVGAARPKETVFKGRAPQQPADPATVVPELPESHSWGTAFVCGGKGEGGREDAGGWVGV